MVSVRGRVCAWAWACVCSLVLLCGTPSVGPLTGVSAQGFTAQPNATINPVVFIQIAFNKVSKVDGVEQLFNADFYMQLFWLDMDRQSWYTNSSENQGPNVNYTTGVGLLPPIAAGNFEFTPWLNSFYDPYLEFVNGDGDIVEQGTYYTIVDPPFMTPQKYMDMGIDPAVSSSLIWTVKDFRYIGSFTTPLDLHNFPYDRQFVQLVIESQWADSSQLYLVYTDTNAAFLQKSIPDPVHSPIIGWTVETITVNRTYHMYNLFPGGNYSRLVISMELQREPLYYVAKIVIGVVLLVLMCVCVFSLAVDEADRQMGTLQVFAGIVTFLFVASADVPKIPYLTRLDTFFLVSFIFTAFMLVTHSISYFWRDDEGQKEEGEEEECPCPCPHAHGGAHAHHRATHSKHDDTHSKLTHITYGPMGSQPDLNTTNSGSSTSSIRQRKSQTVPEDGANHASVELAPTTAFVDHGHSTSSPSAASPTATATSTPDEHKQDSAFADSAFNVTKPNLAKNGVLGSTSTSAAGSFSQRGREHVATTWRLSSCWRKTDTVFVIILFIAYAIACAVILGRPTSPAIKQTYEELTPWPQGMWSAPGGNNDYN